ncbi:MAG: hypothetical protein IK114_14355 [Fibrobacter sp.]|nr:hypothetical protein [Fibrobacter sp.]
MYLKRAGEPDSAYKEVHVAEAGQLLLTEKPEEPRPIGWYKAGELSATFNVEPDSLPALMRMVREAELENVTHYARSCFKAVPGVNLTLHISAALWKRISVDSHYVAGCNPTRYFRPLLGKRFKGFKVHLESGYIVRKK